MQKKIEVAGKVYGKITVLFENGKTPAGNINWFCLCDCGNTFTTTGSNIRTGVTKSCRCLAGKRGKGQLTTHGLRYDPLYQIWCGMKRRCQDHKAYPRYAKKGITLLKERENDFMAFYLFAKNHGWKKGLTIDRENNLKGYYPGNVRFVSHLINNQNTTTSKKWTIGANTYNSSREAAFGENVSQATIMAWCCGYKSRGRQYPPKPDCYAEKKYL